MVILFNEAHLYAPFLSPYLHLSIPPRTLFVHIVCLYSVSRHALAPDALRHIMYPYLHLHATGTLSRTSYTSIFACIRVHLRAEDTDANPSPTPPRHRFCFCLDTALRYRHHCRYRYRRRYHQRITASSLDPSYDRRGRKPEPYLLKIVLYVPSFSRTLALNADKPDYDRLAKVRGTPSRCCSPMLRTRTLCTLEPPSPHALNIPLLLAQPADRHQLLHPSRHHHAHHPKPHRSRI
jgi:hypothetical protein